EGAEERGARRRAARGTLAPVRAGLRRDAPAGGVSERELLPGNLHTRRPKKENVMRFQLALNVENLEEAVAYYSKLFGVPVHKRKPGYANFAVENPPLKLVLFEAPGERERLNHVGFEYFDNEPVEAVSRHLEPQGLATPIARDEACC